MDAGRPAASGTIVSGNKVVFCKGSTGISKGAAGFGATDAAGALGWPVAALVSLVVAVVAAAGFSGFGADEAAGSAVGAADTPAPGESVRDTSPFSGSPGASLAGLSAAACGGVGSLGSSDI